MYAILPLFLSIAAVELALFPWTAALFHIAFGITASLLLMEILFLDFRKVPFTCSHFPGKVNLVFLSVIYVFGFTLYSSHLASLEVWLGRTPLGAALFFLCAAVGLIALSRLRERRGSNQAVLDYEDDGNPAVLSMGLTAN